jgi:hypothetical protein
MTAGNLKTTNGFGKSQPESGKKSGGDVLFARFNNLTEAHHAQQALTCFGYPEDAVTMIELSHIAPNLSYSQDAIQPTMNRILIFGAILISTIFITLTSLFAAGILSLMETGLMIPVWILLTAAGVMICFFIGETVWKLINSEVAVWGVKTMKRWKIWISVKLKVPIEQILKERSRPRGKIWLSVKLKAPGDAKKIEKKWREIATKRHDLWIIQARD